jgi:hypothetical protein
MEAAGIEPSDDFDATENCICDCENCQQCRAANALHLECFKSHYLSSLDADLQRLINRWGELPASVKGAVGDLVGS